MASQIENLFAPSPLSYYQGLVPHGADIEGKLNQDQTAAVLKAHDYGLRALNAEEIALVDQVMSVLKESIWP